MMRRPMLLAAMVYALAALPAASQTLGGGHDLAIQWLRLFVALALCMALAVGAVMVQQRRLGRPTLPLPDLWLRLRPKDAAVSRITAIETRRLSPQVTVSVFRCDDRDFMIACSTQGRLLLVDMDAPVGNQEA